MFPGKTKLFNVSILLFLLVFQCGAYLFAAQTLSTLEGQVFDPSGRIIPEAAVVIVDLEMGMSRHLATDLKGRYQAPGLLPGSYRIEVSRPGFRGEIQQPVIVQAGRTVEVDFHMTVGMSEDRIVVHAEAPLISSRTGDWGSSIEHRKLEDLPLVGRDLFDLTAQTPGASVPTSAKLGLSTGWGLHLSVNGSRPNQNSFRLDGIYINDATNTAPASAAGGLLGIESVSELRIVGSPFSAEYGRAAGALITAVSKSGSHQFHGSVYEFLRNSRLDAKNYFDPADQDIPPLSRNQFGGSLGGPIHADKLFFFANYEGIRFESGKTFSSSTLTVGAREGILPDTNGTRLVSVAPEAQPYINLYPLPNGRDFGDGSAEYTSEVTTHTHEDFLTGRVDYNASEKFRVFGRYTFDNAETNYPDPFTIWTFPSDSRYQFFLSEGQYLPSSTAIHLFRFGFSRVHNSENSEVRSDIPSSLSFLPGQQLGVIYVTGLTSLGGLEARLRPRRFGLNNFQFNYDATYILGDHTLRFGGSFDRIYFNQRSDLHSVGLYRFTSIEDFLGATPNLGDMMYPGSDSIRNWRQNQFSGFVQDEYRIRGNLSATLGVRYEAYTAPSEINGKIATIPDPLHDGTVTIGGPLFNNPSATNFAPRAAIAWDPEGKGKTVIRAGFGVFFDLLGMREISIAGARMPPYFSRIAISDPTFPDLLEGIESAVPELALDTVDFNLNQPYTMQYQLNIEQRIGADIIIRGTYAGMRGIHLPGQMGNINPPTPVILEDGTMYFPDGAPRLNPAFGRITMRRMAFNSYHNSFHAELQRQWNNRWGLQVKYTWSKTIDDTSSVVHGDFLSSDQIPTMFSYRNNRGLSDFDVRHLFAANFSYALADWDSGITGRIFGGWEIHGLFQAQTGYPFSPFVGFDRANLNSGEDDLGQRPDIIAAAGIDLIPGDPQEYFNGLAFGLPPAGKYGNLGRNTLTGPGRVTLDLALHKEIWKTDRHNVRFRLEIFNVSNHPNFQIPSNLNLFNSRLQRVATAGRITATSTPSRQIQMALKWTF